MSSVYVTVCMHIKSDKVEDFRKAFAACAVETRKENGCIQYDLSKARDEENLYLLNEKWASQAHLDEHMKTPHVQDLLKAFGEVLSKPATLNFCDAVDVA
eukprot:Hpha_TRINITY_DN11699_c0_g1::TRINITY_DN11699_c0_g1_i1::g.49148::m.49148